ncbi:MAG: hypothetical protein K2N95_09560 [Lachnospiraceae bacterium]|nr:hypothetical protein [Lachnospiraceae bacterium]
MKNYTAAQRVITWSVAFNPTVPDTLYAYRDTGKVKPEDQTDLGEYLALMYENFDEIIAYKD